MQAKLQRTGLASALLATILLGSLAGLASSSRASASSRQSYPYAQTLVTTGTQWGNIAGTNPYTGNYAVGTVGLCLETLLRYDPLKNRYINWLAKSGRFVGKKRFTIVLRRGIRWSNGDIFTPYAVAWNFRLGRFETAFWHDLFTNIASIKTPLSRIRAKVRVGGKTRFRIKKVRNRVVFTFRSRPNYAQWRNLLWNLPMVHPGQGRYMNSAKALISFIPAIPIGTGPYVIDEQGFDSTTRVVWTKRKRWWAADRKLAPKPKPKYIMDLVQANNNIGLPLPLGDLDNDFLPGLEYLVSHGSAKAYYSKRPYELQGGSVAWLTPNTRRKPLDDPWFRKALATAIDVDQIVSEVFHGLVSKSNRVGLLPAWSEWVAKDLEASKGVRHGASAAIRLLDDHGYSRGADGWFDNKDGTDIDLSLRVPKGFRHWEAAREMIIADAEAAHINLHVTEGEFYEYQNARNSGDFDLLIDNAYQMSDDPWTYFNGNFHLPVLPQQTFANFERYESSRAWALTQRLDKTPRKDVATRKALMRELQDIFLTELPNIPLWYENVWANYRSKYWTNWPAADSARTYVPSVARGYLQMTGIDMITHLKPASGDE